jgi:hypothetical protein
MDVRNSGRPKNGQGVFLKIVYNIITVYITVRFFVGFLSLSNVTVHYYIIEKHHVLKKSTANVKFLIYSADLLNEYAT